MYRVNLVKRISVLLLLVPNHGGSQKYLTCSNFANLIDKRATHNGDLCLPVFWPGVEKFGVATASLSVVEPTTFKRRRKPSELVRKRTQGWPGRWFRWTEVKGSPCSLFEQLWCSSPKGRSWLLPGLEVLGSVKVLSGFSPRLYFPRDCNTEGSWEFCSGPTAGPAEFSAQSSVWEVSSEDSWMPWGWRVRTDSATRVILRGVL